MSISPLAGKPAPASMLVNVPKLVTAYYAEQPDPAVAAERVAFGTSGHRGSAFAHTFNEGHILAITQAICLYRQAQQITGPLFVGMDTHALSEPAFVSALEVLAANGVEVMIDRDDGYTPTPVISHAILALQPRSDIRAGGRDRHHTIAQPAGGRRVQVQPASRRSGGEQRDRVDRADAPTPFLQTACARSDASPTRGLAWPRARTDTTISVHMWTTLGSVIDMDLIRSAGVRIGVDPLGGAGVHYWGPIIATVRDRGQCRERRRRSDLPLHDGGLGRQDSDGLFIAVRDGAARGAAGSLRRRLRQRHRPRSSRHRHTDGRIDESQSLSGGGHLVLVSRIGASGGTVMAVGKTIVSSSIIDRVTAGLGRRLVEVPVGFKWFVDGLLDGSIGFAGEESAGASFARTT